MVSLCYDTYDKQINQMTSYFYIRCSTDQQDETRQYEMALKRGIKKENIFIDKITGVSEYGDRPQYTKMVEQLKPSDCVHTEDLTRYGRSMVQMLVEINKLIERDIHVITEDNRLNTQTMPKEIVRLIVGVMGYASECELLNLKRRTAMGRAVAVARGVKMGRKRKTTHHQMEEIKNMRQHQRGYGSIAKSLGLSKSTVQRLCVRAGI